MRKNSSSKVTPDKQREIEAILELDRKQREAERSWPRISMAAEIYKLRRLSRFVSVLPRLVALFGTPALARQWAVSPDQAEREKQVQRLEMVAARVSIVGEEFLQIADNFLAKAQRMRTGEADEDAQN